MGTGRYKACLTNWILINECKFDYQKKINSTDNSYFIFIISTQAVYKMRVTE